MALSPKQMEVSIIKNLKIKTGKTLQEWIDFLKDQDFQSVKESIAYLKKAYGLGHFQAKIISERAAGIDDYANESHFADHIFNTPETKSIFDYVKEKILLLGSDIQERPCKTYIPFYRKHQFSLVTVKRGEVLLGLSLPKDFANKAVEPAKYLGSERINSQIRLGSAADWNEMMDEALMTAYRNN